MKRGSTVEKKCVRTEGADMPAELLRCVSKRSGGGKLHEGHRRQRVFNCRWLVVLFVVVSANAALAAAQTAGEKIAQLEEMVDRLTAKVEALEAKQKLASDKIEVQQTGLADLSREVTQLADTPGPAADPVLEKLHFGGYGEVHANFAEGDGADLIDLHRLVMYLGYDFADWIQFKSEIELEHGYVTDGADGEVAVEQAHFDFLFSESFNIRAGRILTPLGIINKWHEPTLFNSVERPSFAKYIIPTTWSRYFRQSERLVDI